jgi:hypothetical protein
MLTIIKNVPMPDPNKGGAKKTELRRVAEAMEVGDMVEVSDSEYHRLRSAMSLIGRRVSARKQESGAVRVWRVE